MACKRSSVRLRYSPPKRFSKNGNLFFFITIQKEKLPHLETVFKKFKEDAPLIYARHISSEPHPNSLHSKMLLRNPDVYFDILDNMRAPKRQDRGLGNRVILS